MPVTKAFQEAKRKNLTEEFRLVGGGSHKGGFSSSVSTQQGPSAVAGI